MKLINKSIEKIEFKLAYSICIVLLYATMHVMMPNTNKNIYFQLA